MCILKLKTRMLSDVELIEMNAFSDTYIKIDSYLLLESNPEVWNCHTSCWRRKATIFTSIVYGASSPLVGAKRRRLLMRLSWQLSAVNRVRSRPRTLTTACIFLWKYESRGSSLSFSEHSHSFVTPPKIPHCYLLAHCFPFCHTLRIKIARLVIILYCITDDDGAHNKQRRLSKMEQSPFS
jgi:hypothetical protein